MAAKKMSARAKRAPGKKKPGTPQSPKYCPKKTKKK
jgi:hypothetical protein